MRAGSALAHGFFHGASRLGRALPQARPEHHGVERISDVPYTASGRPEHRLDIYRPARPGGPRPVVIYVHGGGFRILSKDTHWLPGLAFARRGYVVFNIGYRLAPAHPFPAAIEDVATAWSWVARNAAAYGGDPERALFAGESAGANLATSLALCALWRHDEPWARAVYDLGIAPKAVLPAMGLLQVSDPERFWRRRPLPRFLRDRIQEVTWAYLPDGAHHPLADPLLFLEGRPDLDRPLPAFWAAVGTADPLLDDTRRLGAALEALGARHHVGYWPREFHAFHMFVVKRSARACWREMLGFADAASGRV